MFTCEALSAQALDLEAEIEAAIEADQRRYLDKLRAEGKREEAEIQAAWFTRARELKAIGAPGDVIEAEWRAHGRKILDMRDRELAEEARELAGHNPENYPLADEWMIAKMDADGRAGQLRDLRGRIAGARVAIREWEETAAAEAKASAELARLAAEIVTDEASFAVIAKIVQEKRARLDDARAKLDLARLRSARPAPRARRPVPRRGSERRARAPRRRPPSRRARLAAIASGGGGDGPAPSEPASPAPSPRALEGGLSR